MERLRLLLSGFPDLQQDLALLSTQLETERTDLFNAIVETTPNFIGIIQDEKFVFVNSTGLRLLKYNSLNGITGKNIYEVIHPNFHDIVKERLERLKENRTNAPAHIQLQKSDGSFADLETTSTHFSYNGSPASLIAGGDITNELLQKQKLEEEKNLRDSLLNSFPELIAFYEPNHTIRWMNDAAKKFYNISDDSYIGQYCYKIRFNSDKPCADCPMLSKKNELHERIVHDKDRFWNVRHTPIFSAKGEITGYCELSTDITEKEAQKAENRIAQEKLKESEQRFREIFENSFDNIFMVEVTSDGRFRNLDFNPAYEKNTGRKRSELIGKYQEEVMPEVVAKFHNEQFRHCVETKEAILNMEIELQPPIGTQTFLSNIIPIPDTNGDIYRILGIYRDITDQKLYERHLKDSFLFIEKIINSIPDPIFIKDRQHRFVVSNDAHCELRGLTLEELIGKSDFDLFPETEAKSFWDDEEEIFTAGKKTQYDDSFINRQGNLTHIVLRKTSFFGSDGEIYLAGIIHDITERKIAEEKLYQREQEFRTLVENSPDIIVRYDNNLNRTYVNPAFLTIAKQPTSELIAKTPEQYSPLSKGSFSEYVETIKKVIDTSSSQSMVINVLNSDPGLWYNMQAVPEFDKDGNITGILAIGRDVTELKRTKQMTELLGFALNSVHEAAFIQIMSKPNFLYVNERACESLGYIQQELLDLTLFDIDPTFSKEKMQKSDTILPSLGSITFETIHKRKDGSTFPVECTVSHFNFNNIDYLVSLARDISSRKKSQERIEILSYALNNASDAVFIAHEGCSEYIYVNEKACKSLGYSSNELLKLSIFDFAVDATPELQKEIRENLHLKKSMVFQSIHKSKNGKIFPVEVSASLYHYGHQSYVMLIAKDITERKLAEKALQEERNLFIGGPNVAFKWKAVDGWPVEYVSPNIFEQFGYTPEELISGKVPFANIVHPDDLPLIAQEVVHYSETKVPYFEQEYRIICANGEYRWVYDFTIVGRDVDGEISHYKGYLANITERKLAEEKLHLREQEFRTLVENSPDIIVRYDKNCNRIYFNPAFQKLADFQAQELAGTSPTQLSPLSADQAVVYMNTVKRVFETSRSQSMEIHQPFAGNELWFNMRAVPEFDKDGNVSSVLAIARDVTEIKKTKEMSEMLSIAVDNSSDAIFIRETTRENFSYVNQQACKSLGYTSEELCRLTVLDINPDITKEFLRNLLTEANQHDFFSVESRHIGKDGNIFPVEVAIAFFDYADKRYVMNHVRDITERKLAEQALRESEEKFSTVFKLSPASLAITRLSDNVMLDVNNVFLQSTGQDYNEVVGHNQYELDLGLDLSAFEPLMSLGNVQNYEYNYRNREGEIEYGLLSLAIITIGGEYCVLSQSVMITEIKNKQKELEEAYQKLEEQEKRYREMFNNSHDSIYLLEVLDGPHFRLLDANPKYEKEVGIDREKNIGHTIEENTTPEVAAIVNAKYKRCLEAGTIIQDMVELAMPQGNLTYHSSLIPIRNQSGEIYRIMGITRDITEEIKAKKALEDSQRRLAKAELVALLGHTEYDFNKGIYHWSDGAYEILNVPAILRRPGHEGFRDLIHPDDFERVNQALNKAVQEHTKYDEVYRVIDFYGKEKVIHGFGEVAITENGKKGSFFGIIQDITQIHTLNFRLQAEEEKFRILAESSPVGIYLSIGATPVYANKTMFNMVGVDSLEALAKINLTDLVVPEDRTKIQMLGDDLNNEASVHKPFKLTLRKLISDSSVRIFDVHVTAFKIHTTSYLQFIVIDITEDYENEQIRQQLAASSLYIEQKNQFASEIEARLKEILSTHTGYDPSNFKPVMEILKSFSYSEKDWELLNAHLANIHPEFVASLKKQCPALSVNDIKHCACMRLNLDTKEIARLFNVKPESIQTSRSRLKKKLGLPETTDLRAYVLTM